MKLIKKELQGLIVKVKSKTLHVAILNLGVIQKTSPAKTKLIEEMRKLQTHDPHVIQMQGCGYGRII